MLKEGTLDLELIRKTPDSHNLEISRIRQASFDYQILMLETALEVILEKDLITKNIFLGLFARNELPSDPTYKTS